MNADDLRGRALTNLIDGLLLLCAHARAYAHAWAVGTRTPMVYSVGHIGAGVGGRGGGTPYPLFKNNFINALSLCLVYISRVLPGGVYRRGSARANFFSDDEKLFCLSWSLMCA